MKTKNLITSLLSLCCFLFTLSANSQTLLTPDELVDIHQQKDAAKITEDLTPKGYEINRGPEDGTFSWVFLNTHGQGVDYSLHKTIGKDRKKTTAYYIYNLYYFKEFMSNLVKAKYFFTEIKIVDHLTYMAFKKNGNTLLVYSNRRPGYENDEGTDFSIRITNDKASGEMER